MADVPTHLFITEATLLRSSSVQDPGGSPVLDFKAVDTFMCRLQGPPASDVEGMAVGTKSFYDAILYCDPTQDITEKDRVQIGTDVWDVEGKDDSNLMGVILSVRLKRSK